MIRGWRWNWTWPRRVDRAEVSLDTQVGEVIAEVRDTALGKVTLRELCTHTSGLPRTAWTPALFPRLVLLGWIGSGSGQWSYHRTGSLDGCPPTPAQPWPTPVLQPRCRRARAGAGPSRRMRLFLSPAAVTRGVRALEAEQAVVAVADAEDGRAYTAQLSPAGRARLDDLAVGQIAGPAPRLERSRHPRPDLGPRTSPVHRARRA